MPDDDDALRLILARGVGPRTRAALRRAFPNDAAAVHASVQQLAAVEGIGRARAEAIRRAIDEADPHRERARGRGHGATCLLATDAAYPDLLAATPDPPALLWVRGDVAVLRDPAIAIVGSRRATHWGCGQAERFAADFARRGLIVVSGGARGIDAAAHRAVLSVDSKTIAVIGTGFDHCYPPEHARLYDDIVAAGGAVVSEFTCATPARPGHFPQRNRIISGLALGVVVIEAPTRSGACITARLAADDHGRDVFAVPGRAGDAASAGCHALIRDGGAALADAPSDVMDVLELSVAGLVTGAAMRAASPPRTACPIGQSILDLLSRDAVPSGVLLETLGAEQHYGPAEAMVALTRLELEGLVRRGTNGVLRLASS